MSFAGISKIWGQKAAGMTGSPGMNVTWLLCAGQSMLFIGSSTTTGGEPEGSRVPCS